MVCLFALCFVVVECVPFCLICLCVSFAVYCETLYVLFVCAFRVCGLLYVCVQSLIYCVMFSGVLFVLFV